MKRINAKGGFTLIELLVVIAIIGILSSIVLVSLNSARKKGTDTRIISDVQQTRTALESGYNGAMYVDLGTGMGNANCNAVVSVNNTGNQVPAACTNTSGPDYSAISAVAADAVAEGGNLFVTTNPTGTAYAIRGMLSSNQSVYFCLDSRGNSNVNDNNTITTAAQCH